jgi:hypothetical protein
MTEPVTTDKLIAQLVAALRGMTPTQHSSWCMRHEGGVVDLPDGRRVGVGPLVVGTCRCDANVQAARAALAKAQDVEGALRDENEGLREACALALDVMTQPARVAVPEYVKRVKSFTVSFDPEDIAVLRAALEKKP